MIEDDRKKRDIRLDALANKLADRKIKPMTLEGTSPTDLRMETSIGRDVYISNSFSNGKVALVGRASIDTTAGRGTWDITHLQVITGKNDKGLPTYTYIPLDKKHSVGLMPAYGGNYSPAFYKPSEIVADANAKIKEFNEGKLKGKEEWPFKEPEPVKSAPSKPPGSSSPGAGKWGAVAGFLSGLYDKYVKKPEQPKPGTDNAPTRRTTQPGAPAAYASQDVMAVASAYSNIYQQCSMAMNQCNMMYIQGALRGNPYMCQYAMACSQQVQQYGLMQMQALVQQAGPERVMQAVQLVHQVNQPNPQPGTGQPYGQYPGSGLPPARSTLQR